MAIVTSGLFAGMDTAVLQGLLTQAQFALVKLQTGAANVTLSYTQGDGAKSVSKKIATVAECTAMIQQLQMALGIVPRPRRSIRFLHQ